MAKKECKDDYFGETKRRIVKRIKDHNIRVKNSHLLKYDRKKGYAHVFLRKISRYKVIISNQNLNVK